jgi:hypothetical protein
MILAIVRHARGYTHKSLILLAKETRVGPESGA